MKEFVAHYFRTAVCLLLLLLLTGTICRAASRGVRTGNDTIYLFDFFDLYSDGPRYFGATTIFFPNGEKVRLTTRPNQGWPLDFDQFSMLRIILPAGTSVTLPVQLDAWWRRKAYSATEDITLQVTQRKPAFYYGRVLVESCRLTRYRPCGVRIFNSRTMPGNLFREVRDRLPEKGVAYTYFVATGILEKNEVFAQEQKKIPARLLKRFPL